MRGLRDLRVIDFSSQIAGPYCTKLFADAGAEVVKVEASGGDPLRRWSATGADLRGRDSGLFHFLNGGERRFEGWNAIVRDYTSKHTTAELIERASLLRIPVAPVNNGETVQRHEQLVARGVFRPSADGDFVQPRPPYPLDFELPPPARPAPHSGPTGGGSRLGSPRPRPATSSRDAFPSRACG
jgi:crotonobetainyl-CoA:carnitine CoA-transferase CaiB-like acyl-CoA transferase